MYSMAERVENLFQDRRIRQQKIKIPHCDPVTGEPNFSIPDPYPPGASEADFVAFTVRTGIELPDDVKVLLRITNGAAGFCGISTAVKHRDTEWILEINSEWKGNWLPMGRDDFGNHYVKVLKKNEMAPICFVEGVKSDRLAYVVASDALHFAEFKLEERIALEAGEARLWPFNKAYVLSKDPELGNATDAELPWD